MGLLDGELTQLSGLLAAAPGNREGVLEFTEKVFKVVESIIERVERDSRTREIPGRFAPAA